MDNPATLHKLTAFSQRLVELNFQTLETQTRVIKAAGEEDLRTMLLNRYPLKPLYGRLKSFCLTSREL